MNSRVILVAALILAFPIPSSAFAFTFHRETESGKAAHMHQYASWGKNCEPKTGLVKVQTKPQHGKLSHYFINTTVRMSRLNGPSDPCIGKTFKVFQVDYTSTPGFRGVDTFAIEVTFVNGVRDIDYYTVNVH